MKLKTRAPARALKRANGKRRRNAWKLGHQGQIERRPERLTGRVSRKVWRRSEHRRLWYGAGYAKLLGRRPELLEPLEFHPGIEDKELPLLLATKTVTLDEVRETYSKVTLRVKWTQP